jgi:hypothetical protein
MPFDNSCKFCYNRRVAVLQSSEVLVVQIRRCCGLPFRFLFAVSAQLFLIISLLLKPQFLTLWEYQMSNKYRIATVTFAVLKSFFGISRDITAGLTANGISPHLQKKSSMR